MIAKSPRLGALAACALGLIAQQASATTIDWNNSYRNSTGSGPGAYGGEFTLIDTGLDLSAYTTDTSGIIGADSFQTFCIEYNEHIYRGQTVTYALNTQAVMGGAGGPSPDPVSQGTAYLYSRFASGDLASSGFDYSLAGRALSAGLLQEAIWYLEEEIALTAAEMAANIFLTAAESEFGTLATAMLDQGTDASYNVSAVNLYNSDGTRLRQDQLYVGPGASTSVPDGGASVLLFGLALIGIGTVQGLVKNKKA